MKVKIFGFIPLLLVVAVSIYSIFPSIKGFSDTLIYLGDDILITWILNQNIQKIPFNIEEIFNGNIFFPLKNTMVYSVMLVPSSIIGYLPVKLTGSYVSAFNAARIFGQISSMLIVYFWFKEMFKDKWAAAIGSIVLGLSQIHFHYVAHLHVWNMQWWLTALWMVWRYRKNGKVWQLYLAGIMFGIQAWDNVLESYRAAIPAVIILIPYYKKVLKDIRHIVAIVLILIFIVSPYLIAYIGFLREYRHVRTIRDVAHFSMSINNLWEHFFSPALFGLFAFSFLMVGLKKLRKNSDFKWLFALLITSFVLCFGPVLKWKDKTIKIFGNIFFPLPYILFYYTIPGFQAMRTPSRWTVMIALAMAGMIALSISKYKGRFRKGVIVSAIIISIVGGVRIYQSPPIVTHPDEFPVVYNWLKEQPGDAILEYPMYTWASKYNGLQKEFLRMYYSLKHKKNLVNGGSGFMPPERQKMIGEINKDFPGNSIVEKLSNLGVDYVIVHKDETDEGRFEKIKIWGEDKLLWQGDNDFVYKLP